jgi:hypothetical protein
MLAAVPDVSPIQLVILVVWAVCLVGAYRLVQKGRYGLFVIGLLVPPIWLAGFFLGRQAGFEMGQA